MAGYQARERQKVTRRRMDTRNKSDKPYLTFVEAMSFCRLNFSSLRHRRRRGAVSGLAAGKEGGSSLVLSEDALGEQMEYNCQPRKQAREADT